MSLPQSVADVLKGHVTLEYEAIDRMYLNAYVPKLQTEAGVAAFFRHHRGHPFASSALMAPMTLSFVRRIERFVQQQQVPLIQFAKGQRKDDVMKEHLGRFDRDEGVLFVGKAQEKARVFRTERRINPDTGAPYPWIVRASALVNHYYFYCVDRDFGPFFLKFCSYFPYTGKLCLNGHEWLKRQLSQRSIDYVPLDNGILSCNDPRRLQQLADSLDARKIDTLLRRWLCQLPHPFEAKDRAAGYRYDLSIWQAEFSLTQVLDRPVTGRIFFEEVIRENLDIGRPSRVKLIFDRRITKATPGVFRTRVITEGVTPSLHIDYKHSDIKQYHKEGEALRTETTINDTRDFAIGRRLHNLSRLREIGFRANRRLLDVQRISHDCAIGEQALAQLERSTVVEGQRVCGLRLSDTRVQALLSVLLLYFYLPLGFSHRDLRPKLAALLGLPPAAMTAGRMTYDLRRLRLHGLIRRIPKTHRYELTCFGLRSALFVTRVYCRILRPGMSQLAPVLPALPAPIGVPLRKLEQALDPWRHRAKLAP
jgi:hypothetical protein